MVLSGHARPILALDWAPDGFTLATGGEDNTVRVWDIRARKCTYVLPAHSNLVTGLKIWHAYGGVSRSVEEEWEPRANGEVEDVEMGSPTKTVAETPFANTGVSAEYLEPPPVPTEDESMRMAVLDGTFMVTSSYDGTAKMWSAGDWKPLKTFAGHDGKVVGVDVSDGTLLNSVMLSLRLELILSSIRPFRRQVCGDRWVRSDVQALGERECRLVRTKWGKLDCRRTWTAVCMAI